MICQNPTFKAWVDKVLKQFLHLQYIGFYLIWIVNREKVKSELLKKYVYTLLSLIEDTNN